jgi:ribosomal protein S18 acetylase RimI-like enzyme
MAIREIKVGDEEQFVKLIYQIDRETDYMLYEPGERTLTVEQQRKSIEELNKDKNSTFFVAESDNQMVGYLMARGGFANRIKHTLYLVIGIVKDYRGKGIGTQLFSEMEKWAMEHKIHRLELTVNAENKAGIALYKKMGFEIEGTKRDSLCIEGIFVNEYYMAKILSSHHIGAR